MKTKKTKAPATRKPDLRDGVIALLRTNFGERDTEQEGADVYEAFNHAVEFLRARYLALNRPGEEICNFGGPIYAALIDHHGMEIDVRDLNDNGRHNGIYQAKALIEEIETLDEIGDDDDDDDER